MKGKRGIYPPGSNLTFIGSPLSCALVGWPAGASAGAHQSNWPPRPRSPGLGFRAESDENQMFRLAPRGAAHRALLKRRSQGARAPARPRSIEPKPVERQARGGQ